MLSKGQGATLGTYGQLIRALDMDHRAEEAHRIWVQKIGMDLHSVPWQLCRLMISVYYRNNMLEDLVKVCFSLFATSYMFYVKCEKIITYCFTSVKLFNNLVHLCIPYS